MHLCETERRSRAKKSESVEWRKRPDAVRRPRLLLAHRDRNYRIRARGHFQWKQVDFVTAASVEEVHELTQRFRPNLVVLDDRLAGESGCLTCAKIKLTLPACDVVLLGHDASDEAGRFARFVGARPIAERTPDPRRLAALTA